MSAPHEVDKLAYSKYIVLPPVAALLLSVISPKSSKFLLTERTDVTIESIAYVVLTIIKVSAVSACVRRRHQQPCTLVNNRNLFDKADFSCSCERKRALAERRKAAEHSECRLTYNLPSVRARRRRAKH